MAHVHATVGDTMLFEKRRMPVTKLTGYAAAPVGFALSVLMGVTALSAEVLGQDRIVVKAGNRSCPAGPVSCRLPERREGARAYVLHEAGQGPVVAQVDETGRLWWWNPPMAAGSTRTYTLAPRSPQPTADGVKLRKIEDGLIRVTIGGEIFTEFRFGKDSTRPFLYPVIGPTGDPVTRDYPMKDTPLEREKKRQDHRHHQSIWTAHGDVRTRDFDARGSSYWGVATEKGDASERVARIVRAVSGPVFGQLEAEIEWVASDGRRELTENRTCTFFRADDGCRIIDVRILFRFTDGDVMFADTKEGGIIALRTAVTIDEVGGGRMCNSRGQVGEAECWGKPAEWCDYVGRVNGKTVGIAVMDAPGNFRHPTTWHIRGYGLFAANPFGLRAFTGDQARDGSHLFRKGEAAKFDYRILVHKGDTAAAGVGDAYRLYADPPDVTLEQDVVTEKR